MSWGEWMVPEISQEMEFNQRALELELRELIRQDPEAVIGRCLFLARQGIIQQGVLARASRRIAELEVVEALAAARATRRRRLWPPFQRLRLR
jgi:hypothetical protein